MLVNMLTGFTGEAIKKIKESTPEERQNIAKMAAEFLDLSTVLLRESPEFRSAFARIHTEFFRYPESGETIRQALIAEREFAQDAGYSGESRTAY